MLRHAAVAQRKPISLRHTTRLITPKYSEQRQRLIRSNRMSGQSRQLWVLALIFLVNRCTGLTPLFDALSIRGIILWLRCRQGPAFTLQAVIDSAQTSGCFHLLHHAVSFAPLDASCSVLAHESHGRSVPQGKDGKQIVTVNNRTINCEILQIQRNYTKNGYILSLLLIRPIDNNVE